MPEWLSDSGAWLVTVCLLVGGLIGVFVPILPGHLLVLIAAGAHWLMLGDDSGVGWWTLIVLLVLLIVSQVVEYMSGALGTKWFGGTRWGAGGAIVGGIAGMFFMPIGLLVGPLLGAFLFEWIFAKKEVKPASISGVGSVVGTLAGLVVKIVIAVLMVGYFFVDVFFIG